MVKTHEEIEAAANRCAARSREDPTFSAPDHLLQSGFDWIEAIKALRLSAGWSLDDANRAALAVPGWRLWCARRVEVDGRCEKMARHYARQHPDNGFVSEVGGSVVFHDVPARRGGVS